jgi:arginyl-tRNA synthetase
LWTSTSGPGEPGHPPFAQAERVINVIDVSQSYAQQVVYEGLRRLGYEDAAGASEHLAYGKVTLTADAARALGAQVESGAGAVAMSGRAGLQVFADDLLDRLEALVAERAPEAATEAPAIAAAAARYYMLKFSNQQDIAFDFDEALRTTGESGVYLQYAFVRAGGILRKAGGIPGSEPGPPPPEVPHLDRALVLKMADYPRILAAAGAGRNVQLLAKYAFELASAFSAFYDNTPPVVNETDSDLRAWRIGVVGALQLVLGDVLDVIGIPTLERI